MMNDFLKVTRKRLKVMDMELFSQGEHSKETITKDIRESGTLSTVLSLSKKTRNVVRLDVNSNTRKTN